MHEHVLAVLVVHVDGRRHRFVHDDVSIVATAIEGERLNGEGTMVQKGSCTPAPSHGSVVVAESR